MFVLFKTPKVQTHSTDGSDLLKNNRKTSFFCFSCRKNKTTFKIYSISLYSCKILHPIKTHFIAIHCVPAGTRDSGLQKCGTLSVRCFSIFCSPTPRLGQGWRSYWWETENTHFSQEIVGLQTRNPNTLHFLLQFHFVLVRDISGKFNNAYLFRLKTLHYHVRKRCGGIFPSKFLHPGIPCSNQKDIVRLLVPRLRLFVQAVIRHKKMQVTRKILSRDGWIRRVLACDTYWDGNFIECSLSFSLVTVP